MSSLQKEILDGGPVMIFFYQLAVSKVKVSKSTDNAAHVNISHNNHAVKESLNMTSILW